MSFSENLKKLRIQKGLSQKALAKSAGVSQTAIYHWEKGERNPKKEQLKSLSVALQVPLQQLTDEMTDDERTLLVREEIMRILNNYSFKIKDVTNLEEINNSLREIVEKREKLLNDFDSLNDNGQNEALKRVKDLTFNPEYRKGTE